MKIVFLRPLGLRLVLALDIAKGFLMVWAANRFGRCNSRTPHPLRRRIPWVWAWVWAWALVQMPANPTAPLPHLQKAKPNGC